jgi:hypothetical protein
MTDLSYLNWIDYSGAPPLLLPLSLAKQWRGFYIPLPPGDEDDADIDLIIGEDQFLIHDDFDTENPVTDYDRLCERCQRSNDYALTITLNKGTAIAILSSFDNIAWWPERKMLISGGNAIDETALDELAWDYLFDWELKDKKVLLMNSCDHGAAPVDYKDKHEIIPFIPAIYRVETAYYADTERQLVLYRFQ